MFFAGSEEEYTLKNDSCDVVLEVRVKRYCRSVRDGHVKISSQELVLVIYPIECLTLRGPLQEREIARIIS